MQSKHSVGRGGRQRINVNEEQRDNWHVSRRDEQREEWRWYCSYIEGHYDRRCEVAFREFDVVVNAFIRFLEHRTESQYAQEVPASPGGTLT